MRGYLEIAALLGAFILGCVVGYKPAKVEAIQTIHTTDTIYYERPMPTKLLPPTFATARVPKVVFAPAYTLRDTVVMIDSVEVEVEIARRIYESSTYRAQVSGAVVGGISPSLDYIEIFAPRAIEQRTIIQPPRWSLSLEMQADLHTQWVGLQYRRSHGALTLSASAGYEPFAKSTYIGVGASLTLFERD